MTEKQQLTNTPEPVSLGTDGILADLCRRIAALEDMTTSKQHAMARALITCPTIQAAGAQAGYSISGSWRASKLPHVRTLSRLYRELHALQNGIPIEWKRARLAEIVGDPDTRPSDAIRGIHELNLMDGSHAPTQHQHSGDVTVRFTLGIDRAPDTPPEAHRAPLLHDLP